jgi:hypothetical protein
VPLAFFLTILNLDERFRRKFLILDVSTEKGNQFLSSIQAGLPLNAPHVHSDLAVRAYGDFNFFHSVS